MYESSVQTVIGHELLLTGPTQKGNSILWFLTDYYYLFSNTFLGGFFVFDLVRQKENVGKLFSTESIPISLVQPFQSQRTMSSLGDGCPRDIDETGSWLDNQFRTSFIKQFKLMGALRSSAVVSDKPPGKFNLR